MKTKWIFRIFIGLMTCSVFSISQGADKFYFGSYSGAEHVHMLQDSLRFNIICQGVDRFNISSIAACSVRSIVVAPGENSPTHWAWDSHYTLWEAEGFPGSNVNLQYDGGILVNDDSASGGKSMKFSGPGMPRLIQSGPTYYQEPDINYTAEFRLKFLYSLHTPRKAMRVDTPAPVCSIMVMEMVSYNILKTKTIYESDFGGGSYQTFKLEDYTVAGGNHVEFRIYWFGISGSLYIDYVKVYDENGKQLMSGVKDSAITAYVSQDWTEIVNAEGDTVIYRWYGRDEPGSIDLYMPHRYIDGLLKEVSQERLLFQAFNVTACPDLVHEYLLRANPGDFCIDIFPMGEFGHDTTGAKYQQKWSGIMQLMDMAKEEAESNNKDFWLVPQVYTYADTFKGSCDYYPLIYWNGTSWCPHQRDPSPYELRLQTFLGLCYGADGILYFLYPWWIDGYGQLLTGLYDTLNDSTTYKWREIRDFIGPRMKVLGPTYATLEWQGACLDDVVNSFVLRNGQPNYIDSIKSHNPADEPHWVQVGFFENQAGDTSYFMLVNRECLETEGANYDIFVTKTGGPYQIKDVYTDSIVGNVNGIGDYFTVYLGPGEGNLLRLEQVAHGPIWFAPAVSFQATTSPYIEDILAGDFDSDGDSDLALAAYWYKRPHEARVIILKNEGNGDFDSSGSYYGAPCGKYLSSANYDSDADQDLAVTGGLPCVGSRDTLTILLNNGTGDFSPFNSYELLGPGDLVSADFDRDGDYDLAAIKVFDSVAIFLNYGDAYFDTPTSYYMGGGSYLFSADFNGDSCFDLATVQSWPSYLAVLINNCHAVFQAPTSYSVGYDPVGISGGDFDNDHDCDLAVSTYGGSPPPPYPSIMIYKNNGSGSFLLDNTYVLSSAPDRGLVAADFDLDGDLDLAYSGLDWNVYVLENLGNGAFQLTGSYPVAGSGPMVACDLTGDGAPDIAVGCSNGFLSVLVNVIASNLPPNPFSLLTPTNGDTTDTTVNFDWEDAFDPQGDTVRYSLFISTSSGFHSDSTEIHDPLSQSQYTDTLERGTYYWKVKAYDKWGAPRWSNQIWSFYVKGYVRGDANGDGNINSADASYLINYLFVGGPSPKPLWTGDANCDGGVNSADVSYLINYLFVGGPHPC